MLYFCHRGRKNLRELKIKDFSFTWNEKDARYVCKTGDELTENRREDDEVFKREMVFEKGGLYCPVASLEPYIKHLNPKNEFLFQGSKKGSKIGADDVCFDNMAVGERTLAEKMKHISNWGSRIVKGLYKSLNKGHSTALETCGCEARHIIADHDGGHKSESSIQSYYKTDTDTKIIDIVYVNFPEFCPAVEWRSRF